MPQQEKFQDSGVHTSRPILEFHTLCFKPVPASPAWIRCYVMHVIVCVTW